MGEQELSETRLQKSTEHGKFDRAHENVHESVPSHVLFSQCHVLFLVQIARIERHKMRERESVDGEKGM